MRYISILRGINVGGKRKILMNDLKTLYLTLGFENPITYIQSGNVIFDYAKNCDPMDLANSICSEIKRVYAFDVPVIVHSIDYFSRAIHNNPFLKVPEVATNRLHLTFLNKVPDAAIVSQLNAANFEPDQLVIEGQNAFICCHGKYSDSKLTNQFFEKKLKLIASTRNWKTVLKLNELAVNS